MNSKYKRLSSDFTNPFKDVIVFIFIYVFLMKGDLFVAPGAVLCASMEIVDGLEKSKTIKSPFVFFSRSCKRAL